MFHADLLPSKKEKARHYAYRASQYMKHSTLQNSRSQDQGQNLSHHLERWIRW
jgi:hypothetical protein